MLFKNAVFVCSKNELIKWCNTNRVDFYEGDIKKV